MTRRDHISALFYGVVIAVLIAVASWYSAPAQTIRVIDGDTLMLDGVKIRLAGIDAPEHDQPGGAEATAHLMALTADGIVCETKSYGVSYDRQVRACDDGEAMVADGWAWNEPRYKPDYSAQEAAARQAGLGIWAQPGAVEPWIWRRRK